MESRVDPLRPDLTEVSGRVTRRPMFPIHPIRRLSKQCLYISFVENRQIPFGEPLSREVTSKEDNENASYE